MGLQYKLEAFEGPLDLLLHLIDQEEIDIYDIPIAHITDQYLKYLDQLHTFEIDSASEFLVMAATLLSIKSKMLLPKPPAIALELDEDDGVDPREELVQRLIEYRKYKQIADSLREQELSRSLIYSREPEDLTPFLPEQPENPVRGILPADLMLALRKVLSQAAKRDTVARIRRDEISVKDRIRDLITTLRNSEGKVLFSKLFDQRWNREEIVVTFLALLELMKNKRVSCFQHRLFDDIVIQYRGGEDDDGLWADEVDY